MCPRAVALPQASKELPPSPNTSEVRHALLLLLGLPAPCNLLLVLAGENFFSEVIHGLLPASWTKRRKSIMIDFLLCLGRQGLACETSSRGLPQAESCEGAASVGVCALAIGSRPGFEGRRV